MVEIPGASSLGAGPSARSGRSIARMETGQIAAGAAALAAGIQNLGQSSMRLAESVAAKAQQLEDYQVQARWLDWQQRTATQYDEEMRNLPADQLEGYAGGFLNEGGAFYDEGRAFMESIPERLRPEYNTRLMGLRNQLFDGANTYALGQLNAIAVTTMNDGVDAIMAQIPAAAASPDPAGAAAMLGDQARSVITGAPHLTQAQQAEALSNANRDINTALVSELTRVGQYDLVDQLLGADPVAMSARVLEAAGGVSTISDAQWITAASDVVYAGMDKDQREVFDADPTTARSAILATRNDPDVVAEVAARVQDTNRRALEFAGIDATPANLMLAQRLGVNAAVVISHRAETTPDARVSDILPASVLASAGDLAGMTVGEAAAWADRTVASTAAYGHRMAPGLTIDARAALIADNDRARDAALTAEETARGLAYDQAHDALMLDITRGIVGKADLNQLRDEGFFPTYEDYNQAIVAWEKYAEDAERREAAALAVQRGEVNAADTAEINDAAAYWEIDVHNIILPDTPINEQSAFARAASGVTQQQPWSLSDPAAEAARRGELAKAEWLFAHSDGGLPAEFVDGVEAALNSRSPAAVGQALEIIDRMARINPTAAEALFGHGPAWDQYRVWQAAAELPGLTTADKLYLLRAVGNDPTAVRGIANADPETISHVISGLILLEQDGNAAPTRPSDAIVNGIVFKTFGGALRYHPAYQSAITHAAWIHYVGARTDAGIEVMPDGVIDETGFVASLRAVAGNMANINGVATWLPRGVNGVLVESMLDRPTLSQLAAASVNGDDGAVGGRFEFFPDTTVLEDTDLDGMFLVKTGDTDPTYFIAFPRVGETDPATGQARPDFLANAAGELLRIDVLRLLNAPPGVGDPAPEAAIAPPPTAPPAPAEAAPAPAQTAPAAAPDGDPAVGGPGEPVVAAPPPPKDVVAPADPATGLDPAWAIAPRYTEDLPDLGDLEPGDVDDMAALLGWDANNPRERQRMIEALAWHYQTDLAAIRELVGE